MTNEQKAALAAAGYTKSDIEAMTAPPVTIEGLSAEIERLKQQVADAQATAIQTAEQPKQPTAAEIIAGFTAPKPADK